MAERVIKGEYVGSGEPVAIQIREFQSRYFKLLGDLASEGTEVERNLVSERDLDIAPYAFTRDARHLFVFPPQETELRDKEGEEVGIIPGTEPYTLTRVAKSADFDPDKVTANLVVYYDDANNEPVLRISDTVDERSETMSNLSEFARAAVESAFEPLTQKATK